MRKKIISQLRNKVVFLLFKELNASKKKIIKILKIIENIKKRFCDKQFFQ